MRFLAASWRDSCESRKSTERRRASMLCWSCARTRCAVSTAWSQSPIAMSTENFSTSAGRNHAYSTITWLSSSSACLYRRLSSSTRALPMSASRSFLAEHAASASSKAASARPRLCSGSMPSMRLSSDSTSCSSSQPISVRAGTYWGCIWSSRVACILASSSSPRCHSSRAAVRRARSGAFCSSIATSLCSRCTSSPSTTLLIWCACTSASLEGSASCRSPRDLMPS
mmetsp:Transcript_26015/g.65946  ORF Transcript_26015/g.65946 Transcript_26015/m.65946 type:complete len:227 (-) Transcript_26015:228-908(-)